MAETVAVSVRLPRGVHAQILTELGINNQNASAELQTLSSWVLGAVVARLNRAAYRRRVKADQQRDLVMNETVELADAIPTDEEEKGGEV